MERHGDVTFRFARRRGDAWDSEKTDDQQWNRTVSDSCGRAHGNTDIFNDRHCITTDDNSTDDPCCSSLTRHVWCGTWSSGDGWHTDRGNDYRRIQPHFGQCRLSQLVEWVRGFTGDDRVYEFSVSIESGGTRSLLCRCQHIPLISEFRSSLLPHGWVE